MTLPNGKPEVGRLDDPVARRAFEAKQRIARDGPEGVTMPELILGATYWQAEVIRDTLASSIRQATQDGIQAGVERCREEDSRQRTLPRQAIDKGPWAAVGGAVASLVWFIRELIR
ncbi:MAG: hypothetical protein FJ317_08500 [SAR202 cluster bacterium]|nr:hypothetical protein [SAR202 cluster bacterium]